MGTMKTLGNLTEEQTAIYEWQIAVPGFGLEGQKKLAAASVLISRVGGLGGLVAYELAAAGIGKLVLYHAGNVRESDLNRQLLMTHDWIGKPRIESIKRRLLDLNPKLDIVATVGRTYLGSQTPKRPWRRPTLWCARRRFFPNALR
jgi:molybdopterin/thiamine biosynthesis adenylyltransferase